MANSAYDAKQEAKGKVKEVCKDFLLKADEQFASKLQDEEFHNHYNANRKNNQAIRDNFPTVKEIEKDEYQKLFNRHQMLQKLEKEDELIAIKMQEDLYINKRNEQELTDEEIAKQLQESEILYEDFVSHKPVISNANNINKNTNQNLALNNMDLLNFSNDNNFTRNNINVDETNQNDFKLAKYLQDEENKKIQLKTRVSCSHKVESTQDEKLAFELQAKEQKQNKSFKNKILSKQIVNCDENNYNNCQIQIPISEDLFQNKKKDTKTNNPKSYISTKKKCFVEDENYLIDLSESSTPLMLDITAAAAAESESSTTLYEPTTTLQIHNTHFEILTKSDLPLNRIEFRTSTLATQNNSQIQKFEPIIISSSRSSSSNSSNSSSSLTSSSTLSNPLLTNKKQHTGSTDIFDLDNEIINETSVLFSITPPHNTDFPFNIKKLNEGTSKIKKIPQLFRSTKSSKKTLDNNNMSLNNNSKDFENEIEENSFEEESLINNSNSKDETETNSNHKSDSNDSIFNSKSTKNKSNIVESIDPTFKEPKMSLQSKFSSDIKVFSSISSKVSSLSNMKYEVCCDNDTDTFLPVQGQRRGTLPLKMTKKKKTPAQCMQQ